MEKGCDCITRQGYHCLPCLRALAARQEAARVKRTAARKAATRAVRAEELAWVARAEANRAAWAAEATRAAEARAEANRNEEDNQ